MRTQGEHGRPHTRREALGGPTLPAPPPAHRPPGPRGKHLSFSTVPSVWVLSYGSQSPGIPRQAERAGRQSPEKAGPPQDPVSQLPTTCAKRTEQGSSRDPSGFPWEEGGRSPRIRPDDPSSEGQASHVQKTRQMPDAGSSHTEQAALESLP